MSKIIVVGSISMDLVMRTKRIPEGGETIFGDSFNIVPGGKGANQAVAIGRLSSVEDNIYIFGNVGEDTFSADLLSNLQNNNISTEYVGTVPQSTGVAQITLYGGDNRIIYYPGANNLVKTNDWKNEWELISNASIVVLQNEIPHEANLSIAKFCQENKVKVLYNPAPARETDIEMIPFCDFITPNEHECSELFPDKKLEEIIKIYPNKMIVTLGVEGSIYYDGTAVKKIPAIKAEVVDTTGAGDTFNGAFAYAISKGKEMNVALSFATIASHLSVQRFGAQGGMPSLKEIKEHSGYEEIWDFK